MNHKPLIAVVDDEPDILELVSLHLQRAGFRVATYSDGEAFYKGLSDAKPSLAILDLMLPDIDGVDICKYLRNSSDYADLPIIMLTARGDETDRVLGLEIGADDYVTKPFSPRELVARVKAVLRRGSKKPSQKTMVVGGRIIIDIDRHEVRLDDRKISLTSTEFRILQLLASKPGWVFSREKILDFLWGQEKIVVDRTVDVHIKHLREKLGDAAGWIKNIRSVGYKLEE